MTADDERRLRALQDAVLARLTAQGWGRVWHRPIRLGGQSPADLERRLYPAEEAWLRRFIDDLDRRPPHVR